MRTVLLSLLCVLGVTEVFVGALWGRLMIYAQEAPFSRAIGLQLSSAEQTRAFNHYLQLFKDQWSIVTWFGVATIVFAFLLFRYPRTSAAPRNQSQDINANVAQPCAPDGLPGARDCQPRAACFRSTGQPLSLAVRRDERASAMISIEPYDNVDGIQFGESCSTVIARFGPPESRRTNRRCEDELCYASVIWRFRDDQLVESTITMTSPVRVRDQEVPSFREWLPSADPDVVVTYGFLVSRVYGIAVDLDHEGTEYASAFARGRWDHLL